MLGHDLVPLGGMLMIVVLAIGVPLVRAVTRRWELEAQRPQIPSDLSPRLERIEQAVDSIAIEVERISEAQRFTTKLLSERGRGVALPSARDATEDA